MKEFFTNFWSSQSFFERCIRTGLAGLGTLVTAGVIPTGIGGGGKVIGGLLTILPFAIAAGQNNKEAVPSSAKLTELRTTQGVVEQKKIDA